MKQQISNFEQYPSEIYDTLLQVVTRSRRKFTSIFKNEMKFHIIVKGLRFLACEHEDFCYTLFSRDGGKENILST